MSDRSKIEWLEGGASWNPIVAYATGKRGWFCIHVSEGCRHCYAEKMNLWRGNGLTYAAQNLTKVKIKLNRKILQRPLHWRKPRRIFPCSMTDLFGSWVTTKMIDAAFQVMEACPQHVFIILTKRPARMRAYLYWRYRGHSAPKHLFFLVSVEDQKTAEERIPILLSIRSFMDVSVLGVNYEPALGRLSLRGWLGKCSQMSDTSGRPLAGLDLVLAGGESGPRARPSHPDWFRTARDQAQAASVPFFFKQWGAWFPSLDEHMERPPDAKKTAGEVRCVNRQGKACHLYDGYETVLMERLGKKCAGRLLDGREWNEFPLPQA